MYYTSIEQSKKLIEAGLNPETADMFYDNGNETQPEIRLHSYGHIMNKDDIPCWSTGALIDLLPFEICIAGNKNLKYQLRFGRAETEFWITYESLIADLKGSFIGFNTVIDKCDMIGCIYKMVLWCLESGYIKKKE